MIKSMRMGIGHREKEEKRRPTPAKPLGKTVVLEPLL